MREQIEHRSSSGGKVRHRLPSNRAEIVKELQQMQFPVGYAAFRQLEVMLHKERDESDSDELNDDDLDQWLATRVDEIVQVDGDKAAGLTPEQQGELRAMLAKKRQLTQLPMAQLRDIYLREAEKEASFNQESAKQGLTKWVQVDSWELREGVLLALGRNPREIRPEDLDEWRGRSRFVERFDELLLMANRAKQVELLTEPARPSAFIGWAVNKITSEEAAAIAPLREAMMGAESGRTVQRLEAENAALREEIAELSKDLGKPKPTFYKIVYLLAAGKKEEFTRKDVPDIVRRLLEKAPHHALTADDEPVRDALQETLDYVTRQAAKRKRLGR